MPRADLDRAVTQHQRRSFPAVVDRLHLIASAGPAPRERRATWGED